MAVPKKRQTPSRTGMRRAHDALKKTNPTADKTTGELRRSHHVSPDGYYNGRKVTDAKVHK